MRRFLAGFLTGLGLTAAVTLSAYLTIKPVPAPAEVTTTQVSGEKIEHSGFNYTKSNIKFSTKSEGKGEIFTEIPKTNIPEARAWIEDNHGVMLEFQLQEKRIYGASYMRRWNNFAVGGGVLVSESKFEGVKFQAQYWFKI